MREGSRHADLKHYVEEWGMLFELLGSTRMMGRILGWLLVCDPPRQTAKEIADAIGASISSISTTTRSLAQMGMVERVGVPGERSAHFRIRPGVWAQIMKRRIAHIGAMRELVDRGLSLLPSSDEETSLRLREIQSYCEFVDSEFPALITRWEEEWKRGGS